jgi:hypothetical protein
LLEGKGIPVLSVHETSWWSTISNQVEPIYNLQNMGFLFSRWNSLDASIHCVSNVPCITRSAVMHASLCSMAVHNFGDFFFLFRQRTGEEALSAGRFEV